MNQIFSFSGSTALALSLQLALLTSMLLLIITSPIAWWLSRTESRAKPVIEAIFALPIVLPPTVLGFYLLILFSPEGLIGKAWLFTFNQSLSFSFEGLVVASIIYSFPFVLQPLQVSFESLGKWPVETASVLGLNKWQQMRKIVFPMTLKGWITGGSLGFAHTLGEFGVVLMVGGNIPGETRVVSIAIYDHVETLDFSAVHHLSIILLIISFSILLLVYGFNRKRVLF